jgi:hypothetical protein
MNIGVCGAEAAGQLEARQHRLARAHKLLDVDLDGRP